MNDLQRAATRARPALAVLTAELGEPSPDAARALVILGQMLDDIEAGRHPLDRPDDWPQRDHWPDRPHWDRWRWAIKTLAVASGTTAHCSPKYHHMRVDTRQARSDALTEALLDVADVIELASDRERDAMTVADLIPAEAEKMKRWSALRMRADAMATLLCVQPVGREAMADEVQQWIDWWQPSYEAAQRLSADEIAALKTGGWWPPAADRQVAEMPPPVAQRQVPSHDPTIMHAVYVLADYPVLAALAAERTQATRLDGRACRAIYEDARQRIDWQAMPVHERMFAQRLGVAP